MKKLATLFSIAGIILQPLCSFSQSSLEDMGHIHNSVVGINSEPVIYNAVNLNTYELLTTNLQV